LLLSVGGLSWKSRVNASTFHERAYTARLACEKWQWLLGWLGGLRDATPSLRSC
jgi:hypothetical protein